MEYTLQQLTDNFALFDDWEERYRYLIDLKRSNEDSEQSYSERQIYQSALERLAREVAAIEKIDEIKASERLEKVLGTLEKNKASQKVAA